MAFLTQLEVVLHEGAVGGTLLSNLGYASERFDLHVWVARGFSCDFGSVPWFADGIIPRVGKTAPAFVIHDALYRSCGIVEDPFDGRTRVLTRKDSDLILRDAMQDCNASAIKAWIAYGGCRLGGHAPWLDSCSRR